MLRQQADLYDDRNSSQIFNYQAINSGSPINTTVKQGTTPDLLSFPFLNTTKNRQMTRLRARLGMQITVADNVEAGLRLATGSTTNPVSSNQTLSSNFAKSNFLLDRAWLRYQPTETLNFSAGRMANPWVSATELIWDKDVNFDGWAVQYKPQWLAKANLALTSGLFSLESTEANFPNNNLFKVGSENKWLYALQLASKFKASDNLNLRTSLAYYDFSNVQGQISKPCYTPDSSIACSTDHTRPINVQKGNTMMALRDTQPLNSGVDPEYQYFGLASPYRLANLNFSLDQGLNSNLHAQFDIDVVKNLAFNDMGIKKRQPVNNLSPCPVTNPNCSQKFVGGDLGYQAQLRIGYPQIKSYGQWNTSFGYRYVETDAVLDALTDSDFHLGGTNAKGYFLGANWGFANNSWIGAKWSSATEIEGEPLAIDVLQVDVNVRF